MNTRTELEEYKSLVRRLTFIERRLNGKNWEEVREVQDACSDLFLKLREFYGPKIAFEIECKSGEL